jgi:hypothetical protein
MACSSAHPAGGSVDCGVARLQHCRVGCPRSVGCGCAPAGLRRAGRPSRPLDLPTLGRLGLQFHSLDDAVPPQCASGSDGPDPAARQGCDGGCSERSGASQRPAPGSRSPGSDGSTQSRARPGSRAANVSRSCRRFWRTPSWRSAAILVASVAGTAITADLGARTVREELDALQVLVVDPVKNLVVRGSWR